MLPNFFVIGAPRSGTTSLYEYLNSHPDIFMSPVKEPDFFSRPVLDEVHPQETAEVVSLAEHADTNPALRHELDEYEALFAGAGDETRRGEASAVYLGHPTAAWHLRSYVPDAKFIAVLRDPVERAHSHYIHGRRVYGDFGTTDAIGAEGRSIDDEFARVVDAAHRDGPPDPAISDPEVWIRSGFYAQHLSRWYTLFDRDRILVFLFEDLVSDPGEVMRRIFAFLDVDDSFALPTTEAFNASVVPRSQQIFRLFTTRNPVMRRARAVAPARVRAVAMRTRNRLLGGGKPQLDLEMRHNLASIYRDDVDALQDLIGRDLSGWSSRQSSSPTV